MSLCRDIQIELMKTARRHNLRIANYMSQRKEFERMIRRTSSDLNPDHFGIYRRLFNNPDE